tara:strand:- start:14550 stop:14987 length:438 start_codon:yes stop_codon:yes gene_type:complete
MKKNTIYKIIIILLVFALIYISWDKQIKTKTVVDKVLRPVIRALPVNVATRGSHDYKQVGILSGDDGKVLPLYGRRTYNGSHKWNYFTRANDHLSLRIPLSRDGRECDKQNGCEELYDNDSLHVPEYNSRFNIKLYDTTLQYIPY